MSAWVAGYGQSEGPRPSTVMISLSSTDHSGVEHQVGRSPSRPAPCTPRTGRCRSRTGSPSGRGGSPGRTGSAVSCSARTSRRCCPFTRTTVGEAVHRSFVISHRLSERGGLSPAAASAGGWPHGRPTLAVSARASRASPLVEMLQRCRVPAATAAVTPARAVPSSPVTPGGAARSRAHSTLAGPGTRGPRWSSASRPLPAHPVAAAGVLAAETGQERQAPGCPARRAPFSHC